MFGIYFDSIIPNYLASDVLILPPDQLSRQAMLCHRVLMTVHSATSSPTITDQTWTCLLRFLLVINDVLLSPPAEKGDLFIWKLKMWNFFDRHKLCVLLVKFKCSFFLKFKFLLFLCHKFIYGWSFSVPVMKACLQHICLLFEKERDCLEYLGIHNMEL